MGLIPREQIQQVLQATDIVGFLADYMKLKRAGANYIALCPFHDEKTPSFNVSPSRQRYHCFGCGVGGNAISFLMEYERLSFVDAVMRLAQRSGIAIHQEEKLPEEEKITNSLLKVHREAQKFFVENLNPPSASSKSDADGKTNIGLQYLHERGFDSKLIADWGIGYAPPGDDAFAAWGKRMKFSDKLLESAGLMSFSEKYGNYYPRFRHRIMFPIRNDFGEVIAFSGRTLQNDLKIPKYINSPQTKIFEKNKVFFGLDRAKAEIHRQEFALVCEGQIDLIACHSAGFKNAVAPLGTAFTENHARVLRRHAKKAVLIFDSDEAGFKACEKAFLALSEFDIETLVAELPANTDPDEFLRKHGKEKFGKIISQAQDFIAFQSQFLRKNLDINSPADKIKFLNRIAPNVNSLKNFIFRQQAIANIARMLSLPTDEAQKYFQQTKQTPTRRLEPDNEQDPNRKAQKIKINDRLLIALLQSLLLEPKADKIIREFPYFQDVLANVPHGHLIEFLLEADFDCQSPSSIEALIASMPEEYSFNFDEILMARDGAPIAKETTEIENLLNKMHQRAIRNQIKTTMAKLNNQNLNDSELNQIQKELLDLKGFLNEIISN